MFEKILNISIFLVLFAVAVGILLLTRNITYFSSADFIQKENILRIGGSTTVYPFAKAAATDFMEKNLEIIITVSESSSGGGIKTSKRA